MCLNATFVVLLANLAGYCARLKEMHAATHALMCDTANEDSCICVKMSCEKGLYVSV